MSRIQVMFRPWTAPDGAQFTPGLVDRDAYPEIPEECFWSAPQSAAATSAAAMRAEITRLRALLTQAEYAGEGPSQTPACPWCRGLRSYFPGVKTHRPDCPAFTPDGTVK